MADRPPSEFARRAGERVIPLLPLPRGSSDEAGAAPAWQALARAAAAVCERWERGAGDIAEEDICGIVVQVCACIRQALALEAPQIEGLLSHTPALRVIEQLRRAFLAQLDGAKDQVPATGALAILQALERIDAAVGTALASDPMRRLSHVGGVQLVVQVAHDLRSPLTSILFLVETLRRGRSGPITPLQERQLGLVYSAAFGLSSIACDVIEIARGGDRLIDGRPVPFSVTEVLLSVRDIVLPIAEEKGLEMRLVPPEADSRLGYPLALHRILLNLTTNALKYTRSGSVDLAARQLDRSRIQFAVTDTGPGIPAAMMDGLFEPLRKKPSDSGLAFSSSGLGLAICERLVRALGAQLRVDTAEGVGTRFEFTLDLPSSQKL